MRGLIIRNVVVGSELLQAGDDFLGHGRMVGSRSLEVADDLIERNVAGFKNYAVRAFRFNARMFIAFHNS